MGKFNWWRRSKKKAPLQKKNALKGKSFLLQQIENGDYDPSDYYNQALEEIRLCKKEQKKVAEAWKAGPDSLDHKLLEIERKYIKRYNKLMEDHDKEEQRLLRNLKVSLEKEFVVDCWEEAISVDLDQDVLALYYNYQKIAHDKISKELQLEANSELSL